MQDGIFVGLDVHKATLSIAVASGERGGEVSTWGKIFNRSARHPCGSIGVVPADLTEPSRFPLGVIFAESASRLTQEIQQGCLP